MAPCSSPGDCRGGYTCQDLSGQLKGGKPTNSIGAVLADNTGDGMVCAAAPVGAPPALGAGGDGTRAPVSNEVCHGSGTSVSSGAGGAAGSTELGDSGSAGAAGAANDAGSGG